MAILQPQAAGPTPARPAVVPSPWIANGGSLLVSIVVIAVWWAASQLLFVIPTPLASLLAVWNGITNGTMLGDIWVTVRAVLISLLLSTAIGMGIGIPLGLSAYWRRVFEPFLLTANATPKIILFPVVLAIFKIGVAANITMGVIHGMFPVIINTMSALKDLPPIYVKVARSASAGPWQTVAKVYTPAMLLPLITAVRLAFGLSMIGVVLAEIFASKAGVGRVIMHSFSLSQYPAMMGNLMLLYLLGMTGSWLIWRVERGLKRLHSR